MAHIFDFPLQTINISQFGLTARKWQTVKVDSRRDMPLGCHNKEEEAGQKVSIMPITIFVNVKFGEIIRENLLFCQ